MRTSIQPVYALQLLHLRRRFPVRALRVRGILDGAPLADVVLLVFFFFVIQSPFVLQPGIRISLPTMSSFSDGVGYGGLVVTMTQEGMVFFNDERTTLEGLGAAFRRAVHQDPDAVLLVAADGRVRHETLVRVYEMAKEAGISEVLQAGRSAAPLATGGEAP